MQHHYCCLAHVWTDLQDRLALPAGKAGEKKKDSKEGMSLSKADDFGAWYQELVVKAELISYYDVSGAHPFSTVTSLNAACSLGNAAVSMYYKAQQRYNGRETSSHDMCHIVWTSAGSDIGLLHIPWLTYLESFLLLCALHHAVSCRHDAHVRR